MSVLLPSKPVRIAIGGGSNTVPSNVISGDSGIYVTDSGGDASLFFKINGNTAMYVDKFRRLGINMDTALTDRLEINDPNGDCIKMWNNNATPTYIKNQNGSLILDVDDRISNGIDLKGRFYLNESEVLSTASQINYTNVVESGSAVRNKCVVLDDNKSYYGINIFSVNSLIINESLNIDTDSERFALNVKNNSGNCLKLHNGSLYSEFVVNESGNLTIFSSNSVDISSEIVGSGIQYPLQLTTSINSINSGVGIKFNTYNNSNIKRNMSSIETIIINNENNMENSIIKFNNMKNGELFNTVTIRNDGYIICNTLLELSDMRKKKILKSSKCDESLEKIKKVKTYDFIYTNDEKKLVHKGVMAQELHKIIPSAVNVDENEEYTVSSKDLIGYLIDSIKSLSDSVKELKKKVDMLC
jgi:Chaperone of endosialidase